MYVMYEELARKLFVRRLREEIRIFIRFIHYCAETHADWRYFIAWHLYQAVLEEVLPKYNITSNWLKESIFWLFNALGAMMDEAKGDVKSSHGLCKENYENYKTKRKESGDWCYRMFCRQRE